MNDEAINAQLGQLEETDVDEHPEVFNAVQSYIEEELEDLRRSLPPVGRE